MLVLAGVAGRPALAQETEPPRVAADPQPAPSATQESEPARESTESAPATEQTPASQEGEPAADAAPAQLAAASPSAVNAPPSTAALPPVAIAPTSQPEPAATVTQETPAAKPENADQDPWARPYFIKGDLSNFVVRPMTRRNFVGVGAGISAIPNDTNTLLNAFYFTVEPQIDMANPTYNWRLGLGAPLQFELVDTRGLFETCVGEGRQARLAGGSQTAVSAQTGACVAKQKSRVTQNFGQLRRADWDQASDFAKIVRYAVVGGQEQPFYLNVSRLYDQTFGHGTVVRDYNANLDYNTARLGATLDFNRSAVGVQAMANDLVNPDVLGVMAFVRPMRPYSEDVFWRSLSVGVSYVHGVNVPKGLKYENGLFTPSFDQPIPMEDSELKLVGSRYGQVNVVGADVEAKLLRTQSADMKLYLDYQRLSGHGGGATIGSLWRFSYGEPAWRAVRARAEVTYFDPDYLPSFFDTYHDIFQYQYLPAGYKASNGLTYYPTKLQYLEAIQGGRHRMGAYLELSHAFLNYLTVGAVARMWRPVGSPRDAGFNGPSFPDYSPECTNDNGALTCAKSIAVGSEPGFTSLRFHAEIPLRRFLQGFVSYEVFSTTTEKGLGAFQFKGDNEILFSGARLMLLPIFFIQAEARRYFFMQRVNNVNLANLTLQQDQNYHANWTFAINAFVGYEF
jgi:hypothetical protein